MDSAAWRPHFDLALLELAAGNYPAAEAASSRSPCSLSPASRDPCGSGAAARGRGPKGRSGGSAAAAQEAAAERYMSPYLIASVQASLGQRTQAFASLDRAVKERSELIAYLRDRPAGRLPAHRSSVCPAAAAAPIAVEGTVNSVVTATHADQPDANSAVSLHFPVLYNPHPMTRHFLAIPDFSKPELLAALRSGRPDEARRLPREAAARARRWG